MNYEEKQYKENKVFDGRIIKVFDDEIIMPDGSHARREIVKHNGGCSVLPITREGEVVLVRQFRYAYGEEILEIPAGKLEIGENPRDCAIRELKEETGCSTTSVTSLGILYPTPGYTNEKIYIYLAEELTIGENCLDDGEYLDVIKMPIAEAIKKIESNEIRDGKTIIAILRYAMRANNHECFIDNKY